MRKRNTLYTCRCCGYKTLDEKPDGTYEICSFCFWEDDPVQSEDPDYDGGANRVSLRQAQKNFIKYGACDEEAIKHVNKFTSRYKRDPDWEPL